MSLLKNHIELLSPARDIIIGKEAILHGADAVYIGGPSFGARHNASNDVNDIAQLVEFAQRYHAKIFVTLNTILHDDELEQARTLIHELYDAGVDALIVQDMGILELDIPPIELHASTQTDIRSVDKAHFLSQVGFSQLVLARELNLNQIKEISLATEVPLEFFVHGALCVAFSGQCFISHAETGRSANRGDCSQACRLPYTLKDAQGRVVAFDKHLLSMKDNNQSENVAALIDAGIQSFKIEGRYKDMGYVKNITAFYRQILDQILETRTDLKAASSGRTQHHFIPNPDKTFHRGNTDYFVNGRLDNIGAFDSPKFVGLNIGHIVKTGSDYLEIHATEPLTNGDGLNFLIKREVIGFRANIVKEISPLVYHVYPSEMLPEFAKLTRNHPISRNLDHAWQHTLTKASATRKIGVKMTLTDDVSKDHSGLILRLACEDGVTVNQFIALELEAANNTERALQTLQENLAKIGQTEFLLQAPLEIKLSQIWFVPSSLLNQLRRDAFEALTQARMQAHPRGCRQPVSTPPPVYPIDHLTYLANVYNQKARNFYTRFGVKLIDKAYEAHEEKGEVPVMITKHCLRFAFNLCPKQAKGVTGVMGQIRAEPMTLIHQDETITLKFDCRPCEMHVMGKIKPHILKQPLTGSVAAVSLDTLKGSLKQFQGMH